MIKDKKEQLIKLIKEKVLREGMTIDEMMILDLLFMGL